jgi:hypothetical protein
MARKARSGGVNKSAAIRDVLTANPEIKATEAISLLAQSGIKAAPGLFYFIKGQMKGSKGRRRKVKRTAATAMASGEVGAATRNGNVVSTIKKVKGLAADVGGLKKLKALVEALSE